jgi:hypothetical protein
VTPASQIIRPRAHQSQAAKQARAVVGSVRPLAGVKSTTVLEFEIDLRTFGAENGANVLLHTILEIDRDL